MKKAGVVPFFVCIMLVILVCGCTQKNNKGGTEAITVTMTAKQFYNNLEQSGDYVTNVTMNFKSLDGGDTLILQDVISKVLYDPELNATGIIFIWMEGDTNASVSMGFEGNITGTYHAGDEVKITVEIKHVTFSYQNAVWDIELFEQQWESEEYFISQLTVGNPYKPLPDSCIVKV